VDFRGHARIQLPKAFSRLPAQNPPRHGSSQVVLFACSQFAGQLAHKDLFFEVRAQRRITAQMTLLEVVSERLAPTMKASKAFEQQIHRILELLEGSGAEVTWDDHIPDPDNPSRLRQIDITIRRDGKLTLVACLSSPSPPRVTRSRQAIRKGKAGRLRKDEVSFHETKGWQSRLYL
jgi:hypothetical protein